MEIEIKNLYKEFYGKLILRNVNYKFSTNKLIGITGKSGVGKTTLINCIGLLEPITKGKIYFNGKDVTKIKNKIRQKYYKDIIGFLFQNNGLIDSWTVNDNLNIGLEFIKGNKQDKLKLKEKVLEQVGLSKMLSQKVYSLSGGEQQRIALARLLLKDSKVILCDEPSAALDKNNTQIVVDILKKQAENGKIVIISTHDEYIVEQCDENLALNL